MFLCYSILVIIMIQPAGRDGAQPGWECTREVLETARTGNTCAERWRLRQIALLCIRLIAGIVGVSSDMSAAAINSK